MIHGGTKDGVNGYHGTGPYMLTEHKVDENATFEANESYWGGKPEIRKIVAKVLPAGETTFLALQKVKLTSCSLMTGVPTVLMFMR